MAKILKLYPVDMILCSHKLLRPLKSRYMLEDTQVIRIFLCSISSNITVKKTLINNNVPCPKKYLKPLWEYLRVLHNLNLNLFFPHKVCVTPASCYLKQFRELAKAVFLFLPTSIATLSDCFLIFPIYEE